jgi:hypothetical protein
MVVTEQRRRRARCSRSAKGRSEHGIDNDTNVEKTHVGTRQRGGISSAEGGRVHKTVDSSGLCVERECLSV